MQIQRVRFLSCVDVSDIFYISLCCGAGKRAGGRRVQHSIENRGRGEGFSEERRRGPRRQEGVWEGDKQILWGSEIPSNLDSLLGAIGSLHVPSVPIVPVPIMPVPIMRALSKCLIVQLSVTALGF